MQPLGWPGVSLDIRAREETFLKAEPPLSPHLYHFLQMLKPELPPLQIFLPLPLVEADFSWMLDLL